MRVFERQGIQIDIRKDALSGANKQLLPIAFGFIKLTFSTVNKSKQTPKGKIP